MEDEDKNEFKTIWSTKGHSSKKQAQFSDIMAKCVQIQTLLTFQFFHQLLNSITQHCQDRFTDDVARLIVTVQFRRDQIDELASFVKQAAEKFQEKKHQIFHKYPPSKVGVIYMGKCQVREIVLSMYIYLQDHPQLDLVVFIVNEITDLDEYNMYCFEKGLKGKNLVLIICSHHNFENTTENYTEQFQKYHYQLYNSKQLFCQYFYQCMISPGIKPYLPSEVLTLISDMNYYSISYHESCRRFRYCLERSLMLYKKERTFVEFQRLIELIDLSVIRQWKLYEGGRKPISREKILKIILTEKQSFFISERFLALEIAMRASSPKDYLLQQENVIKTIKERLNNHFKKDQKFKKYLPYLEDKTETHQQEKGIRKKKSRFEQLGIEPGRSLTPKQKLDSQITRIIKDATASIRQQASYIKWDDLKYQLRIKPQIPNLIKQAWHRDDDTAELVEQITQNYSMPLTNYLKLFEDEEWGKGIYLLKCLQLAGLIEISKRSIKPIVYTQYFDKATYALKQNK